MILPRPRSTTEIPLSDAERRRRQGGCRPELSERENSREIERDRSSRPCLSKGKAEPQAAATARCCRHVLLGPGQEPAALAARLRLAGLKPDRRIVVLVKVALGDHPRSVLTG
jgi:hypothetical protein